MTIVSTLRFIADLRRLIDSCIVIPRHVAILCLVRLGDVRGGVGRVGGCSAVRAIAEFRRVRSIDILGLISGVGIVGESIIPGLFGCIRDICDIGINGAVRFVLIFCDIGRLRLVLELLLKVRGGVALLRGIRFVLRILRLLNGVSLVVRFGLVALVNQIRGIRGICLIGLFRHVLLIGHVLAVSDILNICLVDLWLVLFRLCVVGIGEITVCVVGFIYFLGLI